MRNFRLGYLFIGLTAWVAGVLGLTLRPAVAMHPTHPLGFDSERAFQDLSGIDGVDLFSGSLSLAVPLGPFQLIYSSNVWRYDAVEVQGSARIRATPDRRTNAGFGWHLGWGEVYHPDHWYNDTGKWLYRGPDGGRHAFYPVLHVGEDDADDLVFYSRDSSYLRLRATADRCRVDIEQPDGSTRRFENGTCGPNTEYTLRKAWSPHASAEDPDQTVTYNDDDTLRTVQDRYGRTHTIHLTDRLGDDPLHWLDRLVTRIEIAAFAGQTLVYELEYAQILTSVSCKDTYGPPGQRTAIPHLKAIHNRADGTSFKMYAGGELLYHNLCTHEGERIDDLPGVLRGIELPTGGKLRWSFQEYEFPPGDNNSVFNTSAGVKTRTLLDADGSEHGVWRYRTSKNNNGCFDHPEVYTEVAYPTGECSKHYFNGRYCLDQSNWLGWEFGLPFVYTAEHGGRYLSSQMFESAHPDSGACEGPPLRSTYLLFRHDEPQGNDPGDWYSTNRQVQASRTVYHDDPDDSGADRWIDTASSDFDGLGHFRRTVTTGTLWDGSDTLERRDVLTAFDRAQGTYFTPEYQAPGPADPWILGTFAFTEATEIDATGEVSTRSDYRFDHATGFLDCSRTLASGVEPGPTDLLTVFASDALGQVTDVKRYGGDQDPLPAGGEGCGNVPAAPVYWTQHAYQHGVLSSSRPIEPDGTLGPFLTYDADIDLATGLPIRQRDASGLAVSFGYDALGRVTAITPDEGAVTHLDYFPATATQPTRVAARAVPAEGGAPLSQYQVEADAFGRPRVERSTLPGGSWTERATERNARGWTTAISQWGDLTRRTESLDFDPFGRPRTIRPPDGIGHDIKISYLGDRRVTTETKLALGTGEAYVARVSESDRYGRLRRVDEASGANGAMIATTYDYDVGSRLTRIHTAGQTRAFTYDNRGFLLSEQHPELGASGNGSVLYRGFDAAGLAHRMTDDGRDLSYAYDFMGRPTRLGDRARGNRLVSRWTYDLGAGFGLGKLYRANHVNYLEAPWSNPGEESLSVRHTYSYDGLGGAVGSRDTHLFWSLPNVAFRSEYRYDEIGNVDQLTYPQCISGACLGTPAAAGPMIGAEYDQGLLTAVPGWADAIDYHPGGSWSELQRCNSVSDHQLIDPNWTTRPSRLHTTGVTPAAANFDSGEMSYDGAGNLAMIGADTFSYDAAGRLQQVSFANGSLEQGYAYDAHGNLESRTTGSSIESFAVDPATNRLIGASYDGSGNLTHWGDTSYSFNLQNRLIRQAHMGYFYDADGERVGSYVDVPAFGPSLSLHLRDPGGRLLTRLSLSGDTWERQRDYVYAGDRLLASTGQTASGVDQRHYHLDHLGSPRLVTDASGVARNVLQFLPYGEDLFDSLSADDPMGFTGHERDLSTGTDYMHARQYLSDVGRFLSADPVAGVAGSPQSHNRYAYVQGNPMNLVDPSGGMSLQFYDYLGGEEIEVVGSFYQFPLRSWNPFGSYFGDPGGRGGGGGASEQTRDTWLRQAADPGGGGDTEPAAESPAPADLNDEEAACLKHPLPVLCGMGVDDKARHLTEKNCFFASFVLASVAGGAVGGWGLAGGVAGVAAGWTTPAIGAEATVFPLGGMAYNPGWTFLRTQVGALIGLAARGAAFRFPSIHAGGAMTYLESAALGVGSALGVPGMLAVADRGINAAASAGGALWRKTPCR